MKKMMMLFFVFTLLLSQPVVAEEEIATAAKGVYLIEMSSGKVLYERHAQEKLFPASMTKMMSLILVFEALNQKQIQLDEQITVSANAASMGGSQVFLEPNEQMSVNDLLKATIIASANDAMVALAEKVSGSVRSFVDAMNQKGKEYGLVNSHFTNATGLHDDEHYSCAQDMGIIAQHLIAVGGDALLDYCKTYDAYIRENSPNPFWLVNTNKLVKYLEGVDGLKTGFTQEAKSCISVTALRDNVRLIAVVMGEPDSKIRNKEVSELLDYGFSRVEYQPLFAKDEVIEEISFDLGNPKATQLIALQNVGVVIEKGKPVTLISKEVNIVQDRYPYLVGEAIGEVKLIFDHQEPIVVPVGVKEDVLRLSYLQLVGISFWRLLA